jgi:hypothetical protein
MSDDNVHLLQKYGILPEFDVVSQTSLKDFMDTYQTVANSSDDIKELAKISKLLSSDGVDIPGYETNNTISAEQTDDPELNKLAYAIIEFMMKKTTDPDDWAYLLTYIINKLNLELGDSTDSNSDE